MKEFRCGSYRKATASSGGMKRNPHNIPLGIDLLRYSDRVRASYLPAKSDSQLQPLSRLILFHQKLGCPSGILRLAATNTSARTTPDPMWNTQIDCLVLFDNRDPWPLCNPCELPNRHRRDCPTGRVPQTESETKTLLLSGTPAEQCHRHKRQEATAAWTGLQKSWPLGGWAWWLFHPIGCAARRRQASGRCKLFPD